jgi:hypothetical protein
VLTVGEDGVEYYGIIEEIIELCFGSTNPLKLVLFKCHWFHPISGVRRSPNILLVEIKKASVLPGNGPFIVAQQATQVYNVPYPCKSTRSLVDWNVVYKVPPHTKLPTPSDEDYNIDPNTNVEDFFKKMGCQEILKLLLDMRITTLLTLKLTLRRFLMRRIWNYLTI